MLGKSLKKTSTPGGIDAWKRGDFVEAEVRLRAYAELLGPGSLAYGTLGRFYVEQREEVPALSAFDNRYSSSIAGKKNLTLSPAHSIDYAELVLKYRSKAEAIVLYEAICKFGEDLPRADQPLVDKPEGFDGLRARALVYAAIQSFGNDDKAALRHSARAMEVLPKWDVATYWHAEMLRRDRQIDAANKLILQLKYSNNKSVREIVWKFYGRTVFAGSR